MPRVYRFFANRNWFCAGRYYDASLAVHTPNAVI